MTARSQVRDMKFKQNFARSMSLEDAMSPDNILCYEMNGEALPAAERLSAEADRAGLVRHRQRQVAEAHRSARPTLQSLLMGRDYVTIREEDHDGETVWAETSVGRWRLKSAPARVTQVGLGLSHRRRGMGRADRPRRGQDR